MKAASATAGDANGEKPTSMKMVVLASAAGTAFEWYDFFLVVPLAAIIAKAFFAGLSETAAYIFALGAFGVGFAFRPLGALIFGRIGDRVGRKATFLICMSLMGFGTFAVGLLPSYAQMGLVGPILFLTLRVVQGLALGGQWGGAAIYICEHVPPERRGFSGSWLGVSAGAGLGGALLVTVAVRSVVGEAAFADWGWRVPFLFSVFLLIISLWIRLTLEESPVFEKMRAEGNRSEKPYSEAFLHWPNLKRVLVVLFSMMISQGAIWYLCFFYASFFMETVIKVKPTTVQLVMLLVVAASVPLYLGFGALSDRIGRKPVMLFGIGLMVLTIFPGFHLLTQVGNPALAEASKTAPVVMVADPAECSLQFDPVGKSQFHSSCDIAKSVLASSGVSYTNVAAPAGSVAQVKIGDKVSVPSANGAGLDAKALAKLKADVGGRIKAEMAKAGYPLKADPARTSIVGLFLTVMIFCVGACALYGPQIACLVEMFPARIRYTALSLPYNIGTGWVGGFLPATVFAMVAASGNIYFGLWYPLAFAVLGFVVMLIFLPETKGRDLSF